MNYAAHPNPLQNTHDVVTQKKEGMPTKSFTENNVLRGLSKHSSYPTRALTTL